MKSSIEQFEIIVIQGAPAGTCHYIDREAEQALRSDIPSRDQRLFAGLAGPQICHRRWSPIFSAIDQTPQKGGDYGLFGGYRP
jgi:hypothetical protein